MRGSGIARTRCAGPLRKAVGPFGNEGRRRCPNDATHAIRAISPGGYLMKKVAVCDEHLPAGQYGVIHPEGWGLRVATLTDASRDTGWTDL